jgi:hypothetical protein
VRTPSHLAENLREVNPEQAISDARLLEEIVWSQTAPRRAIYGAATLLALIMTMTGSLRPILRAARVDPAITIRTE